MTSEQSNFSGVSRPSQKLVLPPPDAAYAPQSQQTQHGYAPPEYFLHSKQMPVVPVFPFPNQKRSWRKDPAFIVLLVSICAVLFGGVAFAAVATTMFSATTNQPVTTAPAGPQGSGNSGAIIPTPISTSMMQPTQVPTTVPTTVVQPSPTVIPTAIPTTPPVQTGPLTVQFDNVPAQVSNNSVVPITVTTSQANTTVRLIITYNASPFFLTVGPQMTDANGTITLSWKVAVRAFGHNTPATARVLVVARSQNNQQVTSQPFTVQIVTHSIVPQ